jgi:hypothetical protein
VRYDAARRDRFRARYGLKHKFVVMYSGNHSPIHPLDTLLEAENNWRERGTLFSALSAAGVSING